MQKTLRYLKRLRDFARLNYRALSGNFQIFNRKRQQTAFADERIRVHHKRRFAAGLAWIHQLLGSASVPGFDSRAGDVQVVFIFVTDCAEDKLRSRIVDLRHQSPRSRQQQHDPRSLQQDEPFREMRISEIKVVRERSQATRILTYSAPFACSCRSC